MEADLNITLLAAPDEQSHFVPEYQQGLRAFEKVFNDQGVPIDSNCALAKMAGGPFLSGEFVLKLAATVGPVLGTAVGAWLHARYGRRVRLKIGEIEAEAQTVAEVENLLKRAGEFQQRNQHKVIH
jgi:hypothetical protein